MRLNTLHNQTRRFLTPGQTQVNTASNDAFGSLAGDIPDGLVGGSTAGNIMALLIGKNSRHKIATRVSGFGAAALLDELAYRACKNWNHTTQQPNIQAVNDKAPIVYDRSMIRKSTMTQDFEIKLIKVMIASKKADGHVDAAKQRRIFHAIDHMDLSIEIRAALFNLLNKPIDINAITHDVEGLQQKSALYLAAYLVTKPKYPENRIFIDKLATSLGLPEDLQQQLALQASYTLSEDN